MNYLTVVNKTNLITDDFYNHLELVDCQDVLGDIIQIEKETYNSYVKLKKYLEQLNIVVEIDSAYRSLDKQQKVIDNYTKKYGLEYVKTHVAAVRTSEHHTGLCLDLALVIDGKKYYDPVKLQPYEDIFLIIHQHLSEFGFILRYPKGKEDITGYSYEPWHIRYVGVQNAKVIFKKNLTLEEYITQYKKGFKSDE